LSGCSGWSDERDDGVELREAKRFFENDAHALFEKRVANRGGGAQ
jgi:hypothetical protein